MGAKDQTQLYIDFMARAIKIADSDRGADPEPLSAGAYQEDYAKTTEDLDTTWKKGLEALFTYLNRILTDLEAIETSRRFAAADAIAKWMDARITYEPAGGSNYFSLSPLIPFTGSMPFSFAQLNSNYEHTNIRLFPKFEVGKLYDKESETLRERSLANRKVFNGLNNALQKVGYINGHPDLDVQHVVIHGSRIQEKSGEALVVAFCPLSDRKDLLKIKRTEQAPPGYLGYDGISLSGLNRKKALKLRLERDLQFVCEHHADILFFPEMLGTEELEQSRGQFNAFFQSTYRQFMDNGLSPPTLTFLPSFWHNGTNSVTAVYQNGMILGRQEKSVPYVDEHNRRVEALAPKDRKSILMIHIPGVHRIAVMICAEYLQGAETVCKTLGATLVIVPSYSKGEEDFVRMLSQLECYGTTVVWGNCCGAKDPPRVIGGCSIAGTDNCQRFRNFRQCGDSCKGVQTCAFLVTLPLRLTRKQSEGIQMLDAISHVWRRVTRKHTLMGYNIAGSTSDSKGGKRWKK